MQRIAVSNYCRMDFEGSRLTEQTWQKMRPLMYEDNFPDFNVVEIVSRYQVSPADGISLNVDVSYNVLGRYQRGYGYTAAADVRYVTFRVEDKKGEVVITNIEPNVPRVSKKAAIAWLKTQLEKAENPIAKSQIEATLKELDPPAAASAATAVPSETK